MAQTAGSSTFTFPVAWNAVFPPCLRTPDATTSPIVVPTGFPNIVSLYIVVQTGSRNEVEPGKSGFAHLFEHLMFRGTPRNPPAKYTSILKAAGADQNASTNTDVTTYFTTFSKEDLDKLAETVPNTKGYIITVEGGTDSVGPADYNYGLSERRASSVIQYLGSKYNIPAHKIYVIGLGKDKPVEENKTREGRAANRRVNVRLMTNTTGAAPQQPSANPAPPSM